MAHLVTGAGSGIGAVVADRLVERGDEVILIARSAERAHDLRAEVPGATVLVADLAEPTEIEGLGPQLPERLESVIHAAGVIDLGSVEDLTTQLWAEQLTVNVVAPAVLTRIALPALRAARGTVVFVNSGAGLSAAAGWSAYAASKHALRALADSLRAEEQPHGVRVTTVFPGRTATPMQQKVHEQEGRAYRSADWIDPATVAAGILHVLDLGPDATISDLTIRPV